MKDPNQSEEEYYKWYVKRRIGSLGLLWSLSGGAWLGINGLNKMKLIKAISELKEEGKIISVKIENVEYPFYMLKEELDLLQEILRGVSLKPEVSFIAPLDNLLWDRKLIKRIFDFEYVWEVYKPVCERKYGYYVLPVLYGERFIARFEPDFDKNQQELIIKNWWWEERVCITSELKNALIVCFEQFLNYLGGNTIKFNNNKELEWLSKVISN